MTRGRVLVTGATGFVGRAVTAALVAHRRDVRRALRTVAQASPGAGVTDVVTGDLDARTPWEAALAGVDAVIHLAARVHVLDERAADPLAEFRRVNVEGTRALAQACVRHGVCRLVHVSTVKVHGEATHGRPFTEADRPAPEDPYGVSKMEAEAALQAVARDTGLEVVVVRPPLVYGPGVGANFLALLRAVDRGLPLPLGAVRNRRSLVYVGNLVDALVRCVDHPAAAGGTFLVDDGAAVSSPELVRAIALALGRPARLLPVPPAWLRLAGALTGRRAAVERLLSDLEVDSGALRRTLDWMPPWTPAEGLADTVAWYRRPAGGGR